jgi:hypothetical protein
MKERKKLASTKVLLPRLNLRDTKARQAQARGQSHQ